MIDWIELNDYFSHTVLSKLQSNSSSEWASSNSTTTRRPRHSINERTSTLGFSNRTTSSSMSFARRQCIRSLEHRRVPLLRYLRPSCTFRLRVLLVTRPPALRPRVPSRCLIPYRNIKLPNGFASFARNMVWRSWRHSPYCLSLSLSRLSLIEYPPCSGCFDVGR